MMIFADIDPCDALALSHSVAELVTVLRTDNYRCDARAQRLQVINCSLYNLIARRCPSFCFR
jgi:hypothetical protein